MVALELVNYGSTGGEGKCPPQDTYVLQFKDYTTPEQVPEYVPPGQAATGKMVTQFRMIFTIVGGPDDLTEEEREEWIGADISTFVNIPKDLNNEKSTLGLILKALKPRTEPFGFNERIPLPEYVGLKMKAFIQPKASGWPKISNFAPATRRPSASRPAPVAAAPAAGDDDWE
jgi:hypothetical protein